LVVLEAHRPPRLVAAPSDVLPTPSRPRAKHLRSSPHLRLDAFLALDLEHGRCGAKDELVGSERARARRPLVQSKEPDLRREPPTGHRMLLSRAVDITRHVRRVRPIEGSRLANRAGPSPGRMRLLVPTCRLVEHRALRLAVQAPGAPLLEHA